MIGFSTIKLTGSLARGRVKRDSCVSAEVQGKNKPVHTSYLLFYFLPFFFFIFLLCALCLIAFVLDAGKRVLRR